MNEYENYEIEDLLCDEFFIEWVLKPQKAHQAFWPQWLQQHTERAQVVASAQAIIKAAYIKPAQKELSDADVTFIADSFMASTSKTIKTEPKPLFKLNAAWLVAAVILACLAFGLLFFKYRLANSKNKAANFNTTNTIRFFNSNQGSKLIRLSDGSLVVLKPNSEISYLKVFATSKREVYLNGEAFFEVRKNPSKPFLVHTKNMVTKVLGTSFTVRAFSGNNEFNVTVNTGKVQVYNHTEKNELKVLSSVTLLPNQQAILKPNNLVLKKDTVTIPLMLSPVLANKLFLFTNTALPVIISKLEEAYHVSIVYDKAKFADATITASLSKLPLEEKIKAICKAVDARYEFTDDCIIIK